MSENNLHGSPHDFPENHHRQPVQPVNPDPMFTFPPEFPYPDPGYAGPFIVINQIESPTAPESAPAGDHDRNHPTDSQDAPEQED